VHGIARVSNADLARLRQYPRLNVFSAPVAGYSMIFLNLSSADAPFFQDKPVRQALSYALDRQQIVNRAMGGNGIVVQGPILPGTWAFDSTLPAVRPDMDMARALLDAAGWTVPRTDRTTVPPPVRTKGGKPLAFTLLTSSDATHVAMAREVADQWATLGVSVTVKSVAMLRTNYLEPRSYEAALIDLLAAGDPDPYPFWHETQVASGQNFGGYKDRDMSEILEQARRTNDRNVRQQLYQRFQQMFMNDVPAILLTQPVYTFAVDERVHDVQVGPLEYPSDRFRTVADWYIVTRRVITSEREP
jgi:peptide/nickel transport system substrate-binding protein